MGKGRTLRVVSCVMLALVCLMPALCLERQSNLFLFGTLGVLLGSFAALVVLALSYGERAQRAIPLFELAGVALFCASFWFLLQAPDRVLEWVPPHWALYVPFLERVVLCSFGALSAFCLALTFWNGQLALRPLSGAKGSLLFGLLALCFIWGVLFEGFWFAVWLAPANQKLLSGLLSAAFAFCLYGLVALLCCKTSGALLKGGKGNAPILIVFYTAFFAAGQLSWGLLNRLWGSDSWNSELSLVCLILLLITVIFAFVRLRRFSEKPLDEVEPCVKDEFDDGWLAETFGLSAREGQAVSLVIKGLTSEEAAEKMGVKAPTVRTYLQRVYKKGGVQGLDELAFKITEARLLLPDASANEEDGDRGLPSSCRLPLSSATRSRLSFCLLFSFGLIVGLVLVPHSDFFGDMAWRVSQIHSQLMGLFLALAGGFVFALTYLGVRSWRIGLLVSSVADSLQHMSTWSCLLFALLLFASLASFSLWIALMAISAAAFVLCSILLLIASTVSEGKDNPGCSEQSVGGFGGARIVALLILFVMCGYAFEDAWRPATDDFTWWIQTVFLVVLVLCLAARVKDARFIWISLLFALFSVLGLGCGIRVALLVLILCFWFCLAAKGGSYSTPSALPSLVAVFGLSMLSARWFTDAWWDQMSYGYVSAVAHGGFWLIGAVVPAIELLFVAASFGSLIFLVVFERVSREAADPDLDESRVSLYLESRGLTSLESDVLLGLAQGKTGAKLAHELHYAAGTINTARWSAYKKLGIHNRDELIRLFESNGFALADGVVGSGRDS